MGEAIKFFANNLGLGFGIGIIIVTLIVRLIILPLMEGNLPIWKDELLETYPWANPRAHEER